MVSKVWATEGGLRGIYKGLMPTLAREVPGNALMFGAYEALKLKARELQVCDNSCIDYRVMPPGHTLSLDSAILGCRCCRVAVPQP